MNINPTIVGFYDDGFENLIEELEKNYIPSSYDQLYTYLYTSLKYIEDITVTNIENEINSLLERDDFPGDTVYETYDNNNVSVVCILDDLSYVIDFAKAIEATDTIFKKYRGKVHFIYLVEDPSLIEKAKELLDSRSTFFDGIIYSKLGSSWSKESLYEYCEKLFNKSLDIDTINEIERKSGLHFGTYKRLYQDEVTGENSVDTYIELLMNNFDKETIRLFKRLVSKDIDYHMLNISEEFYKVGILEDGQFKIPLISNFLNKTQNHIKEFTHLLDVNSNLVLANFTRGEQEILKLLMLNNEIVSKEELGKTIWKHNFYNKYSDWAIDQRIKRLRDKIVQQKLGLDIETIYGKGYKIREL